MHTFTITFIGNKIILGHCERVEREEKKMEEKVLGCGGREWRIYLNRK